MCIRDRTYTDRILNASPYENMQELLVASDVIISDYSGCAFDFPMIGKPGFLYAEDYEEMKRTKDYYFDLKDLPFTLALTNDCLLYTSRCVYETAFTGTAIRSAIRSFSQSPQRIRRPPFRIRWISRTFFPGSSRI